MNERPQKSKRVSLEEFLDDFMVAHTSADDPELIIDITQCELEQLGFFLVKALLSWAKTIDQSRLIAATDEEMTERPRELLVQ
ncbi:MAG TPA: hypothetical protein VFC63_21135 [Blastocatellia bacterium]|nr:hypothetical protein [Blastocatellia bacterium]